MAKYKPYSYSKISTFKSCPLKFKFQYIDKIPGKMDTVALIKGRTIHYLIENSHLGESEYSEEMKQNIKDYPEALEIKKNFENSNLGIKYLKNIDKPAMNEYKLGLSLSLEGIEYSKDSLFNGIVDYICVKSGYLYLIDFKSGKYKEPKYQDYNQLLFYAIYFFQKYKIPKIIISFVYVEHDIENDIELNIEYLDNYKRELLTSIVDIESCTDFQPKTSRLCDYCGFQEICVRNLCRKLKVENLNMLSKNI